MNIGIFDSGRGGRFVASKLEALLPQHTYEVVSDPEHAPYGERSYAEIRALTHAAIVPLVETCPLIVIACNTATAAAIDSLRKTYPETLFVGFEPMIKPAALLSDNATITLLATRATAHASRTNQLIREYADGISIITPNTLDWARSIDAGEPDAIDLSEVAKSVAHGSDVIVVGCTHYIALLERLEAFGVPILEPTDAVARQIELLTSSEPHA
ncbi:MAG TPA: aspartate/glutamate racemase family protein [Patescibacteria group bacterium]|jgi:glutamate racemase|nr:aspartate/glutamate racemase family protein [Patescibacteria group bacterium]